MAKLLADRKTELPATYQVKTGGGGRHLYFVAPEDPQDASRTLKIGCRAFGSDYPGIDVRGDGGYVVAPPSVHESGSLYELITETAELPPAPWPLTLLPPEATAAAAFDVGKDETTCERAENAIERARERLASMPAAVQGQNGSKDCLLAAVECFRFGLTAGEVFSLLSSDFNPRCKPPWTEAELVHKVESALTQSPIARDSIASRDRLARKLLPQSLGAAAAVGPGATSDEEESFCYYLPFEKYVTYSGGRWQIRSPLGKEAMSHWLVSQGQSPADAKEIIASQRYPIAFGSTVVAPVGGALPEPMIPDPDCPSHKLLNLYARPKLQPLEPGEAEGACPTVDALLHMLTSGDEDGIRWLKNWCAALVQRPDIRGQTCVVLYSEHTGTGKTTFGNILATIVGWENCAEIGQQQLSSGFNASFANSLFVVANEVFSPQHFEDQRNRHKALVTDATITVNQKYTPEYAIPNRLTWLLTTNRREAVRPEGKTDRRYAIFESAFPKTDYKEAIAALYGVDQKLCPGGLFEVAAFARELLDWNVDWRLAGTPYENGARAALVQATRPVEEAFLDECFDVGPAEVVRQYQPENWRGEGRPPDDQWNFGEFGIAQQILAGAFQTFCQRNDRSRSSMPKLTLAARARGIYVKRYPRGRRLWLYAGWSPPKVELEVTVKAGRLLSVPKPTAGPVEEPGVIGKLKHLTSSAFSDNGPGRDRDFEGGTG